MYNIDMFISSAIEINGEAVGFVDEVTIRGLETLASCLASPFAMTQPSWMTYISIGAGENAPSSEDLHLDVESHRKAGSVSRVGNAYIVQATFGIDEPSGSTIIREVGIQNELQGGDMGARWVLDSDYYKGSEAEVIVQCIIWVNA